MATADRIAAYFSRQAPAYRQGAAAAAFEPVRRAEEAAVDALMGPVRDLDVLELGCGDGHYSHRFVLQGGRVLGVDVSPGLAERARARGLTVVQDDAATVTLQRTFPRILCAGLLEFVDHPEAVLHNALRHAEPHAAMVVLLPRNTPMGRLYRRWHGRRGIEVSLFDDGALPAMAQRTGWRVVAGRHAGLFAHVARLERYLMRVLFLVNGLGLGNATRCHAVIQRLHDRGATVEVCSFGNGAWYLAGRPEVARLDTLEPVHYGSTDGQLSVARTVAAAGELLAIARRNDRRIASRIASLKPDVIVTDSVYSVRAVRRSGVPWVALNNADVVHATYHRFPDRPRSVRAQFLAVEENDRRFHGWLADRVVSPTLDPTVPTLGAPFHRIGPIVRGALPRQVASGPPRRILIMLSGSVFGSRVDLSGPLGLPVDVVGRERGEDTPDLEGVTWHGKVRDNLDLVRRADLAVVNGGFSAVSELFCLGTPMIVVPVPHHAEQWVNARTIAHLGVGAIGSEDTLEDDLRRGLERLQDWRAAYRALPEPPRGAEQAAAAIAESARLRSPWT